MPLVVTCSKCSKRYNLKDEHAGKTVNCKCGTPIRVPRAGGSAKPAGPPQLPQGSRSQKPGNSAVLWGLLGGGFALLVVVAVVLAVTLRDDANDNESVARSDRTDNRRGADDNKMRQRRKPRRPKRPDKKPRKTDRPKIDKKRPKKNPKPPPRPTAPVIVGDWRVTVDPPRTTWALPNSQPPPFELNDSPVINFDMLTRINSPYLTMFKNFLGNHRMRVFDLRTGTQLCDFPLKGMYSYNFSPSPDGRHVTTVQLMPRLGMIHSVATGKVVATFPLKAFAMAIDFLDAERLLVIEEGQKTARVIDVATGTTKRSIDLGFAFPSRFRYELSPGGKFVAIANPAVKGGWQIELFNLDTGKKAGSIFVPLKRFWNGRFGMAFSPDGKQFAFLTGDHRVRLWCCDIASGMQTEFIDVPKSDKKHVANLHDQVRRSFRGQRLMFTPDGKGWLIQGHLFLNRQTRELTWAVPFSGVSGYTGPYRFVGNDLFMIRADRQGIPAARKKSFWVLKWPPAVKQ